MTIDSLRTLRSIHFTCFPNESYVTLNTLCLRTNHELFKASVDTHIAMAIIDQNMFLHTLSITWTMSPTNWQRLVLLHLLSVSATRVHCKFFLASRVYDDAKIPNNEIQFNLEDTWTEKRISCFLPFPFFLVS